MYIYKITNHINNRFYIGLQSKSVEDTSKYYGSGKLIKKAIEKYGIDNFSKDILERDIASIDVLNEREMYWIKETKAFTSRSGYNQTEGGSGTIGYIMSNATRAKMSKNHNRDRQPPTVEHRLNLSKAKKGIPQSKEHVEKRVIALRAYWANKKAGLL